MDGQRRQDIWVLLVSWFLHVLLVLGFVDDSDCLVGVSVWVAKNVSRV
jgi:hypothetical protein